MRKQHVAPPALKDSDAQCTQGLRPGLTCGAPTALKN